MVYVFLADGFEEIEALAPVDILRRAGIETATVGVTGQYVHGSHGITVKADVDKIKLDPSLEMIVIPGGHTGTMTLDDSEAVDNAVRYCVKNGVAIAAICAGPSVLGRRGILSGKSATCFPTFAEKLEGANYTGEAVCRDGLFITGKSAGHSLSFGLELVKALRGEEAASKVSLSLYQNA